MKTKRIIAIDDERVILDSIVKLCSAEGWHVDVAEDALSGFKMIQSNVYDLIVCDIMMPEMDGFELLEKLRQQEIRIPVIITTGFSTVENAVKSLYNGAIDFLPKPFTFDELISSLKRGLNYAKIQKQVASYFFDSNKKNAMVSYIPCPPRYLRLGYSTWAFKENDGSFKIGITDLFLRTIENIKNIEMLDFDGEIIQGNNCCQITSDNELVHSVLSPLSGRIIKRNEHVIGDFTLVEKDPYFRGWLYIIVPSNLEFESKHLVPCSSDRI
ncbi:MAG: response regulator [Calditrichaeota bacterium]|nr:MAG: response regulator [Calditrichota bacterium]MBL1205159.1 response regulator [Calditrichota bacterium]NOG44989.1 response regulator [Calditrichota bacterium]